MYRGLYAAFFSCTLVYEVVLTGRQGEDGFVNLVGLPLTLTFGVCGDIMKAIRLLVVYNPRQRKRWGRFLKEKYIARGLLYTTAGLRSWR